MEWIPHKPCFDHGPYVFSGDGSRKLNSPLSEYVISMIVIQKKHPTKEILQKDNFWYQDT